MISTRQLWKPYYQEAQTKIRWHKVLLGWLPTSCQDQLGRLRRYSLWGRKGKGSPIVAVIDGSTFHGGLADRWKGIISVYALAKSTGREFKIYYTYPFDLAEFQVPAAYNWQIQPEDISENIFTAKLIRITGETTLKRLQSLPRNKQIHVYANRDCIQWVNETYGTHYTWSELFHELFRPSALLQQGIDVYRPQMRKPYIAIAFRMQNLLGDYPEYEYQPAFPEQQEEIIKTCLRCIETLHHTTQMRVLVTSDSKRMTERATELPYVWTNQGKAAHVDTLSAAPVDYYLKSFVDFYLLANAQKVYAPYTTEMYHSEFPVYAAKTGNHTFERIPL